MNDKKVSNEREKKARRQGNIVLIFSLVFFGFCGFISGFLMDEMTDALWPGKKLGGGLILLLVLAIILIVFIAVYLQMFIHETGHMIFGLMSGYKFQSIRYGSLIIYKTNGRIKIGKLSIGGTAGQCLMTPPEVSVEELPTVLYNLGGIIVNFLSVVIFGLIYFLVTNHPILKFFSAIFALTGLFLVITNGIPVESAGNDGYNAINLGKDIKAKRVFKNQLLMITSLSQGVRVVDMPEEWFTWDYDLDGNAVSVAGGINRLSWLVCHKRFEEIYEFTELLLSNVASMVKIHQLVVTMEQIFSMIMLNKDKEEIKKLFTRSENEFQLLKTTPSTQRVIYAYYKLIDIDEKKADEARDNFNKIKKKYPYPSEIADEEELIDMVNNYNSYSDD